MDDSDSSVVNENVDMPVHNMDSCDSTDNNETVDFPVIKVEPGIAIGEVFGA
ncbi:hypothetical protein SK128_012132, partial [Halocaridina rubra]